MRIISGSAGGRKIVAPEGQNTRPITDRAKEGIFNMLMSLGGVEDAVVFDLFAGSGSFGLECLSRGSKRVTFVERNRDAQRTIEANLETLGFGDRATMLNTSVEAALSTLGHADIIFCDPPYADDPWQNLLEHLDGDILIGHGSSPISLPIGWGEVKRRKYGRAHIVIAESLKDAPGPESAL